MPKIEDNSDKEVNFDRLVPSTRPATTSEAIQPGVIPVDQASSNRLI